MPAFDERSGAVRAVVHRKGRCKTVIGRCLARPDQCGALRCVFDELLGPTRAGPGYIGYELFVRADRPNDFVTVERWRDAAAVEAHMASTHVARAFERGAPLLADAPGIVAYERIA